MIVDGAEIVLWEPPVGVRPDLGVIDRLARMQLDARRKGCELRLRNPCPDLLALVRLTGLSRAFGLPDDETDDEEQRDDQSM
jgi:anti-anti-sigma regulatory factor